MPAIPVIPFPQAPAPPPRDYSEKPAMDPDLFRKLVLYGAKNDETNTNFATDVLKGAFGDIPAAGMDFLKKKVGQFGNFIFGDPNTTLDGAPMPGGYNQDYLNLPYETRKRFDESMMN